MLLYNSKSFKNKKKGKEEEGGKKGGTGWEIPMEELI